MMAAAWRALLREAWERSVVFTQFICFLNVFSNHVAEVHQWVLESLNLSNCTPWRGEDLANIVLKAYLLASFVFIILAWSGRILT